MERYRRVAITTLSAGFARVIGALTLLVSVRLTLSYLGPERYGLWMTAGSAISILSFSDFGIGNGLVNAVSEANGKDDRELAKRYVSSGFFMLTGIALVLVTLFAVGYPWIPWYRLFNVHTSVAMKEAGPAMAVFFAIFLVNLPLGVVSRIQIGYQQGFANNLWAALGSLFALAAVVAACKLRAGLPWIVFAMAGTPVFATVLNGSVIFGAQRPWLLPSWRHRDYQAARKIFRLGMMFFVLQVAVAVGYSSDNIVVAQILGAGAVAQYSVPAKMFNIVTMLITTVLTPLWPAYSEAMARGDFAWVKNALKRSMALALIIAVPANSLLIFAGNRILHIWVGNKVAPTSLLLTGFAVWGIVGAISNPLAYFLNGANIIRFQVVVAMIMAATNLAVSILLTHRIGISGAVWGSVIAQTAVTLIPCAIFVPRLLRSLAAKPLECVSVRQ